MTMPSIADQTLQQLGGRGSVLARQRREHVELDGLLEELQQTGGTEQDEVLTRVWRLVFRHAWRPCCGRSSGASCPMVKS